MTTISARETISRDALLTLLLESKGSKFVSLKTRTPVRMRKTNNPFHGRVEKISTIRGLIGFKYQNSVNSKRKAEGNDTEFVAGPRPWGRRIEGAPVVEHKGKHYVEVKVGSDLEDPVYLVDCEPATTEQLSQMQEFLGNRKDSEIKIRAFSLNSIIWFNYDGHAYSVEV